MENKNIQRLLPTLATFILMMAVQKLLNLLCGMFIPDQTLTSLVAFLTSVGLGIYFFCARPTMEDPESDQVESDGVKDLTAGHPVLCVLGTLAAIGILVGLMSLLGVWFDGETTVELSLLSVLSLLVLHPILEEYIYRRLFYGELRRLNPIFACLTQGVMFAISHDTTESILFALLAGVTFGALMEVSGTFLCGVAAHLVINLRSFWYLTFLRDRTNVCYTVDMFVIVGGAVALIAALVLHSMGVFQRREAGDGSEEAA